MRNTLRSLAAGLLLVLLAACGSSSSPITLENVWGGVLTTSSGQDFAIFVMDVSTEVSGSTGSVSGPSVVRFISTGQDLYLNVSGRTTSRDVSIALTDSSGSSINLVGRRDGRVFRGTWSAPVVPASGTMRMVAEENVDLLTTAQPRAGGSLKELFDD